MMTRRNKKIKAVSNNENSNKTVVQKTKKSNSKAKHLKDVTNLNTIKKEKDASENKSESKNSKKINKTDTLSKSSSNTTIESVAYEEKRGTEEIIEENSSNLPDKDDNEKTSFKERRKSRWLTKPTKIESVGYEEEQGNAEIIEENSSNLPDKDENDTASFGGSGRRKSVRLINRRQTACSVCYEEVQSTSKTILEHSSTLPDKDDNEKILTETAKLEKLQLSMKCFVKLENYCIMESQNKIKTEEPEMKECAKTTTEYSSNLPDKNDGRPVSLKKSTKMETVGYEEEQCTSETILENSSTLPDTDENEGSVHKKLKKRKVTFDEIQHIKRFTSNRHPGDKSNSNNMTEKNASENKSDTAEIIEEYSSNLPYEDDNETASLEGLERRKSRRFIKPIKIESVGDGKEQGTSGTILESSSTLSDIDDNEIILTESAKLEIDQNMNFYGNLEKLEDAMKIQNTAIKTQEPEIKQCTETATECSSSLSDTDEIILTESVKLELMECLSNSNSKLKRKLSNVKVIVEELQNYLKRFKSS